MENELEQKLSQIEQNLKILLEEKPQLKDIKKKSRELLWEYWKKFDNLIFGITKEMWLSGRITWPDYITRSRRRLMAKIKEVDNPQRYKEGDKFRKTLSNKEKKQYKEIFE